MVWLNKLNVWWFCFFSQLFPVLFCRYILVSYFHFLLTCAPGVLVPSCAPCVPPQNDSSTHLSPISLIAPSCFSTCNSTRCYFSLHSSLCCSLTLCSLICFCCQPSCDPCVPDLFLMVFLVSPQFLIYPFLLGLPCAWLLFTWVFWTFLFQPPACLSSAFGSLFCHTWQNGHLPKITFYLHRRLKGEFLH